uniref:beta strand repeat-containing protein n=1 Tax=Sphingomonas sp. TaxID=28214 RepID=UPI00286AAA94
MPSTRFVLSDLTIGSGMLVSVIDPDLYAVGQPGDPDRPLYVYDSSSGTARFTNLGSISAILSATTAGRLHGLAVARTSATSAQAQFFNAAGASFSIDNRWTDGGGDMSSGFTTGLFEPQLAIGFRNDGVFSVRASSGDAFGAWSAGVASFLNQGSVTVTSPFNAVGLFGRVSSPFDNRGTIIVQGGVFGEGVHWDSATGTSFANSGTIRVTTGLASTHASVGLFLGETSALGGGGNEIVNSGMIEADVAIMVSDATAPGAIADTIRNSGTILGDVRLGLGADVVINSGAMNGRTLLGEGNDQYAGGSGRHDGSVEGGPGSDQLTGGSFADTLFGDTGDDQIVGGGGDDMLDGGWGSDRIDGSAGYDTASYAESPSRVLADLAAGTGFDGAGWDRLLGIEALVGSRFDDVLIGSGQADSLRGLSGDDRIEGGVGNDVLRGDSGADLLSGGAGNDLFQYQAGDGADTITDFANGDRVRVYGFAAAQSLVQSGPDVVLTLAGGGSIRFAATQLTTVQAGLTFAAALLDTPVTIAQPAMLVVDEQIAFPAGTTVAIADAEAASFAGIAHDAGLLLSSTGVTPQLFNAGAIAVSDSGARDSFAGVGNGLSQFNPAAELVNRFGAALTVDGNAIDLFGTRGLSGVWNDGTIRVTNIAGRVTGLIDATALSGVVVNGGTIAVDAATRAVGIGQSLGTGRSAGSIVNSGAISVHGGTASVGIEWKAGSFAAVSPSVIVNAGSIIVADDTLARDSAGIALDWSGSASLWNSGAIRADYALRRADLIPGYDQSTLSIFNSGSLIGDIDLRSGDSADVQRVVLINSGSIMGNVSLHAGADVYDGRQGVLVGSLSGGAGDDVLLAGTGDQTIDGGTGDDLVSGGAGSDVLTGGAGADLFRFEAGYGADIVTDFNPAAGDRIVVRGYSGWASIVQQGADVAVTFAAGDVLLLRGQQVAAIAPALFTFDAAAIAGIVIPAAPTAPAPPAAPPPIAAPDVPILFGGEGEDVLVGGVGADVLRGFGGNDVLTGGGGADVLSGGAGADLYRDTAAGHAGDTILDFAVGDRIVFSDANPASFAFSLTGPTLSYSGGSLTLANALAAPLVASAAPGGGVELRVAHGAANDFNGDGRSDILWRNIDGTLGDWFGSAGGFTINVQLFAVPAAWRVVGTGDFNGDGRSDILWRNSDGSLGNWLGDPNGYFAVNSAVPLKNIPNDWHITATGDFNGDGRSDILWRNDSGALGDWLGNASGNFDINNSALIGVPIDWKVVGVGDFNGDGRS